MSQDLRTRDLPRLNPIGSVKLGGVPRKSDRLIKAHPAFLQRPGMVDVRLRITAMAYGQMVYDTYEVDYGLTIAQLKGDPEGYTRFVRDQLRRAITEVLGRPLDNDCFLDCWKAIGNVVWSRVTKDQNILRRFARRVARAQAAPVAPGGQAQWMREEGEARMRLPDGHADKLEPVRKSDDVMHY